MFTDVPANINMSMNDASAYTVGALSLNALGQAFKLLLTGSVLLRGNMLQLQYAEPGGFTVDNIISLAQVVYKASDSLEAMSALS